MITILILATLGFIIIKHRFFWEVKNEIKFPKNGTVYMSHRGYKKTFPENTMGAYKDSVKLDFQWIELDIIATKDNVIICSHNFDLEKETNGTGDVDKIKYTALSYLYTGIYNPKNNTEKLPKLVNVINELPESIYFNIEIYTINMFSKIFHKKCSRCNRICIPFFFF